MTKTIIKVRMGSVLFSAILCAFFLTACGGTDTASGLKTGPTVTPIPDKATESEAEPEFNYTDEEVDAVLNSVLSCLETISIDYDFEITDEMICDEVYTHEDKSSEQYVYDENDNMLAVLMYDADGNIYRAHINYYEGNTLTGGSVYLDGKLSSYFMTEAGTGAFRVDVEIKENNKMILSYVSEGGVIEKEISY